MDPSASRHLAFLLSLGAIPLGCSGDDESTEGASASATTTAATESASASATTTAATAATETAGTTTATGGETTTTGATEGVCEGYAQWLITCYSDYYAGEYREFVAYCTEVLLDAASWSPECLATWESYFLCITALDCAPSRDEGAACEEAYLSTYVACSPAPGPICLAWGVTWDGCDLRDEFGIGGDVAAVSCQVKIDYSREISEACGQAEEDLYACMSALNCEEILGFPSSCPEEDEAVIEACSPGGDPP